MCTPGIITQAITTTISAISGVSEYNSSNKQEEINNQYRKQVALNNIKQANKQAQELQQTGIEKAREAKIDGLRKIATLKAQNSSNGFSSNSTTNLQGYNDDLYSSYNNANNILDDYNKNANSYFQKANSYLNQYNNQAQNYNQKQYKSAINSLGNMMSVAQNWYSKNIGEENEYI